MRFMSLALSLSAFALLALPAAFSANAQTTERSEASSDREKRNEQVKSEMQKNVTCALLAQAVVLKEPSFTAERAQCPAGSSSADVLFRDGDEEINILVMPLPPSTIPDGWTPERFLRTACPGNYQVNKLYGDVALVNSTGITFISRNTIGQVSLRNFENDELAQRFAKYLLDIVDGK